MKKVSASTPVEAHGEVNRFSFGEPAPSRVFFSLLPLLEEADDRIGLRRPVFRLYPQLVQRTASGGKSALQDGQASSAGTDGDGGAGSPGTSISVPQDGHWICVPL
jgi:hypothetical protein